MASTPEFSSIVRSPQIKLNNASGTTTQTIFTVLAAKGAILRALWATSNDTTSRFITLIKNDGTQDGLVVTMRIPAATTSYPVQIVNFLDPNRLTFLNPYDIQWHVEQNDVFKAKMETAITASAEITVFAQYGEF